MTDCRFRLQLPIWFAESTETYLMAPYNAVFHKIDGLAEEPLEPHYDLAATGRNEAESEALKLPRPKDANFIRLYLDGQYEAPQIGLQL